MSEHDAPTTDAEEEEDVEVADQTVRETFVGAVAEGDTIAFGGETFGRANDNNTANTALTEALADWPQDTPLQVRADGQLKSAELTALFTTLRRAGLSCW